MVQRFVIFKKLVPACAAFCLTAAFATSAWTQQVTGAIFTTVSDGTRVNANIYLQAQDVYLNGGPQKNGSALAPGKYYFQVTDPSGNTLLSTDPAVCRQVTVGSNGLFSGYVTVAGCDVSAHAQGTSSNGAVTVQLFPFDPTPNAGGEYKAWLIAETDACNPTPDTADPKVLDFVQSCAKTDNFKVKQNNGFPNTPIAITGSKYYDTDTSGTWQNPPEVPIPGWKVNLTLSPGGQISTFTGQDGMWGITVPSGTSVVACEVLPPSSTYVQTGPVNNATATNATAGNKCWTTTDPTSDSSALDFGNVCLGAGGGLTLGYWSNRNGQNLFNNNGTDLSLLVGLNLRNANGSDFNPANYNTFKSWILNATATNMAYMLSAQLAAMELNVAHNFVNSGALIFAPGSTSANASGFATVASIMAEANTALYANGQVLSGSPVRAYQEALKNALDAANNNATFVQSGPCSFVSPY